MTANQQIKQTILYYPTISVPSGKWLRQALLYWDEIGSIVPRSYDDEDLVAFTTDIQYLKSEGEFRTFRPDLIVHQGRERMDEFETELADAVLSERFQRILPAVSQRRLDSPIHEDKVSVGFFDFLRDAGLAIQKESDWRWYYFERKTALLYMALLAKYLADEDTQHTVSGTNIRVYEKLNFGAKSRANALDGICVRFLNILPVPRREVSLQDILYFKRTRKDQLLHFRQLLSQLQRTLSSCERRADAIDALSEFENRLKKGISDLEATLDDAGIATFAGSLESLIKASSPGWIASAVVAYGVARNIAEVPVSWVLGRTLVAGAIGVRKYLIDKRNERRTIMRNSPFSYLYSASRDRITN